MVVFFYRDYGGCIVDKPIGTTNTYSIGNTIIQVESTAKNVLL